MIISKAQLRTLTLLASGPAHRVYRSRRADDYSWVHEQATGSLTGRLHRLLFRGTLQEPTRSGNKRPLCRQAVIAVNRHCQKVS